MSIAAFTFTDRARPIVELGIGDVRAGAGLAVWDTARWDTAGAYWAGTEPTWLDVTCDVYDVRFEYGRRRTTERFVPGQATINVNNASGWADPNAVDEPGVLSVRPGRPVRISIDHVVFGRVVVWRGFLDALTPTYRVGTDAAEFACIDALGEVNRAKAVPVDPAVGLDDTATARVHRILDSVGWPTSKRDVRPSAEPLLATNLGGQVADLLGVTADSAGGAVFGDLDASIAFRGRDWQTFLPGTPPDGTIGNVPGTPGYVIPGVPAYLDAAVGNATTSEPVDDPTGQVRITADPTDAAAYWRRVSSTVVAVGRNAASVPYPGRLRSLQYEAINRARLVFPGVAGNNLSTPDLAALTGDVEIVARLNVGRPTTPAYYTWLARWSSGANVSFLQRVHSSGQVYTTFRIGGVTVNANSTASIPVGPSAQWIKTTRSAATGVVQHFTAPDSPTEPTAWAKLGTDVATPTGPLNWLGVVPLTIGAGGTSGDYAGRIMRVILRNGIAGPAVLDVSENNAGVMTDPTHFVATSGQVVTVAQTAGNTIVQPQPDALRWRFAAVEYPGTGTSYVDPRGRTWTLTNAAAIVPAVPDVVVPAVPSDVCPVQWERPFARADITTRAIIGRDLPTAVTRDDQPGIAKYGIEPFERVDLITKRDSSLAMLADRVLRVRGAASAPRVRSVTLDARTSDAALDLMTTVSPYLPSRYRCRLVEDRGPVFDEEYFATGVAHTITPHAWSLELNLDAAAPFIAAGGRWDGSYWGLSTWSAGPGLLLAELRDLIGSNT